MTFLKLWVWKLYEPLLITLLPPTISIQLIVYQYSVQGHLFYCILSQKSWEIFTNNSTTAGSKWRPDWLKIY